MLEGKVAEMQDKVNDVVAELGEESRGVVEALVGAAFELGRVTVIKELVVDKATRDAQ